MTPGRRRCLRALAAHAAMWTGATLLARASALHAQLAHHLSLTTGGPGGVYQPLGSGIADLLSRYVPGLQVTAEATQGSVENLKLIGAGKADFGFSMVDAAWQAAEGLEPFRNVKFEPRTLLVLYPNRMQVVTIAGSGIDGLPDLKRKRVSTGAPGSGVEVMALRVLEAAGIDPTVDVTQSRLGVAGSVAALKDGQVDAFFWVGGVPTPAIAALAATPGIKLKLIDHAEVLEALNLKFGPLYTKGIIAPAAYPGMDKAVENLDVWNILVATDKMSDQVAYDIVRTLFERQPELAATNKEARNIDLRYQSIGSPIPYHPGARRYLEERGVRF